MPDGYAIIIGSGFDDWAKTNVLPAASTAYGQPSAPLRQLQIGGKSVVALPRHGDAHEFAPHRVNYRANITALKDFGVSAIIGLHTVGFINRRHDAGDIVVPSQIIDYTWGREHTFYDGSDGVLEHIEFTNPFSQTLRAALLSAARRADVACFDGGVYAATQGPRLETAAEVDRLAKDGVDLIGMTAMPEASLAREASLDYASLSLLVNPAAGLGSSPIHDDVERHTVRSRASAKAVLEAFFETL